MCQVSNGLTGELVRVIKENENAIIEDVYSEKLEEYYAIINCQKLIK